MATWHIGCSGFYYKHWKGGFYPIDLPQKKWFQYYNNHFKTLELNVTFYRFPQLKMVEGWYEKSTGDFTFSVKAPRLITHFKQFLECNQLLADFYGVVREGLKGKAACILFQLPPRIAYKEERLQRIISSLDYSFTNVLEFRHETWWNNEVYNQLAKHNITFCGQSHPLLPETAIQNNSVFYYRFHGVPNLYRSPYSEEKLRAFVAEIEANKKVKEAFIYFNNDIEVSAIQNALDMERFVAEIKKAPSKRKTL